MGALPFRTLAHFPYAASISPSCIENEQPKNALAKNLHDRFPSPTVKRLPRRLLLQLMGFNPILLCIYPVIAAPMPEIKEPEVIRTVKLASGVRIQEIVEGEGPEAHEGDMVEVNYVCRRTNGYFVHSTVDQFNGESRPITLPLDENQVNYEISDPSPASYHIPFNLLPKPPFHSLLVLFPFMFSAYYKGLGGGSDWHEGRRVFFDETKSAPKRENLRTRELERYGTEGELPLRKDGRKKMRH
ncbi:hypothetical protein FH972_026430 [Carpinus fangiana]|uniref:peptidylprolyl isomerase n=1 Tax=Carpinus fangiana TaxID=176857 RepID=A0A5N6L401_9ROSI|nr:hypothetical protein FH972_026430 [Carpinus fangiana]